MWVDCHTGAHSGNTDEIETLRADATLDEICWPDTMRSFPIDYKPLPLLRG